MSLCKGSTCSARVTELARLISSDTSRNGSLLLLSKPHSVHFTCSVDVMSKDMREGQREQLNLGMTASDDHAATWAAGCDKLMPLIQASRLFTMPQKLA